ncbi:hypothetical protein J5J86_04040 [Aquabacter sp. L1I39]|uniref:hypothetical protein n=1 Tax=Aquabacter sp. L1I39 TaxID=2820278 RepID=UPI001ADA8DF8|nr:hypothetical protein [Aquabacter sp. L1I39]QTL04520.1 hypothetical protein J5J86_04040 [Aquabacter sp. L1I39]
MADRHGSAPARGIGWARVASRGLVFAILTLLVLVIIIFQQQAGGAFVAEFSANNADEASHYVTGLLFTDYARAGFPSPLAFARDYYLHYPKVGIGHWPPLYYMAEGLLFLASSPATPVALFLPALIAALLVASAGFLAALALGPLVGVGVGTVLLALPLLREATLIIMLDLPVALLVLLAILAYGRYLAAPRWVPALIFGLLAAMAILTKGTGAALALVPPFAVLLTGRFGLLRRPDFWLPLPVVAVIAGPWTLGTYSMAASGFQYGWGTAFIRQAAETYWHGLLAGIGGPLVALAALGLLFVMVRTWRGGDEAPAAQPWAAVGAGLLAVLAFQCIVPAGLDPRYLLPAAAPLLLMAAYGLMGVFSLLTRSWPLITGLLACLLLLVIASPFLLVTLAKPSVGMVPAARAAMATGAANPLILVGSDAMGEGALVASVAQADRAMLYFALRGSKLLAVSDWNGKDYAPLYPDAAALMRGLDDLGIGYVVLDTSPVAQAILHNRQLAEAAAVYPDRFRLLGTYPRSDRTGEVRLYQLVGNESRTPDRGALQEKVMQGRNF